jgi:hypothetical protein
MPSLVFFSERRLLRRGSHGGQDARKESSQFFQGSKPRGLAGYDMFNATGHRSMFEIDAFSKLHDKRPVWQERRSRFGFLLRHGAHLIIAFVGLV